MQYLQYFSFKNNTLFLLSFGWCISNCHLITSFVDFFEQDFICISTGDKLSSRQLWQYKFVQQFPNSQCMSLVVWRFLNSFLILQETNRMTRTKKLLWCIGSSANILSQKYLIITNMVQIYIIHYIYVISYIIYYIPFICYNKWLWCIGIAFLLCWIPINAINLLSDFLLLINMWVDDTDAQIIKIYGASQE